MKQNFKVLITSLVLLLGAGSMAFSQNNAQEKPSYKIFGKVIEQGGTEPVAYATVALLDAESKKVMAGAVADFNGVFTIAGFKNGSYIVQISFVGYQTFTTPVIKITNDNFYINLGNLNMSTEAVSLSEVTVVGQRELIEEKVDRTVYNAEYDKTLIGGDASDVMRRVPMLSVDLDGNVSMRGSSNILVLINGRQSAIVASNVADALKQIPAEEIKAIEVITSPSAKYDAEGTGGVINIVTKKNNLQGGTLNVNSSAGFRGSNLGLNGNLKTKKMSFSLGGFGRAGYNILGSFQNEQMVTGAGGNTFNINQSADTRSSRLFGRYNLGWDYELNKYNFLTASVSFGVRDFRNFQDGLLTETFAQNVLLNSQLRDVSTINSSNSVDVNFNYTKTFEKPVKEMSISGLYSQNNQINDFVNTLYNGSFEEIDNSIKNNNFAVNQEYTIQLDFVEPIGDGKTKQIEYGAKNILRRASSDFAYFEAEGRDGEFVRVEDTRFSNAFSYDQNVTAGYASLTTNLPKNFMFKGGLRYEYTYLNADFKTEGDGTDVEIEPYGNLIPSVNLSKRMANRNTIKWAYNRRIQRPFLNFLNPNINAANPQQISQGNPELLPELTDNFEMGYSMNVKKVNLNFTSYYRNTTGSIQAVRTPLENDIIYTTFENIGREQAIGLSMFASMNPSGKFSLNGSIDSYYAMLTNGSEDPQLAANNAGLVVSGRASANYTLPKNWQLQFFGFVRGRQVQLQGTQGAFGIYSLSLNKQFNEKRGSLGFGVENFLQRELRINSELITPTIMQQSMTATRNFNFKVNFAYRIGKISTDQPSRRKRRGVSNDDIKQNGGGDDGGGMN